MEQVPNQFSDFAVDTKPATSASHAAGNKLSAGAMILCGWPLLLVLVGGAVGGLLGGLAMGVNVSIYKTTLPMPAKLLMIVFSGIAAIGLWLAIAVALALFLNPQGLQQ